MAKEPKFVAVPRDVRVGDVVRNRASGDTVRLVVGVRRGSLDRTGYEGPNFEADIFALTRYEGAPEANQRKTAKPIEAYGDWWDVVIPYALLSEEGKAAHKAYVKANRRYLLEDGKATDAGWSAWKRVRYEDHPHVSEDDWCLRDADGQMLRGEENMAVPNPEYKAMQAKCDEASREATAAYKQTKAYAFALANREAAFEEFVRYADEAMLKVVSQTE